MTDNWRDHALYDVLLAAGTLVFGWLSIPAYKITHPQENPYSITKSAWNDKCYLTSLPIAALETVSLPLYFRTRLTKGS